MDTITLLEFLRRLDTLDPEWLDAYVASSEYVQSTEAYELFTVERLLRKYLPGSALSSKGEASMRMNDLRQMLHIAEDNHVGPLMWYFSPLAELYVLQDLGCEDDEFLTYLWNIPVWIIQKPEEYLVILGSQKEEWAVGLTFDEEIEEIIYDDAC